MAWFVNASLVIIVLAFLLGLLVGWLWWARRARKVLFNESDAISKITSRHHVALQTRDAAIEAQSIEIARLTGLLTVADAATGAHHGALAEKDERISGTDALVADTQAALAVKSAVLADTLAALATKSAALADREALIAGKDAAIADRDGLLSERDTLLTENEAEIARLSSQVDEAEAATSGQRETLTAREAALAQRDAEVYRLTRLVAAAQATADRQRLTLAAHEAALTAKDAEIARLSAPNEAIGTKQSRASTPDSSTPDSSTPDNSTPDNSTPDNSTPAVDITGRPSTLIDLSEAESRDNLQRIEGIGPRIAAALNQAGIHTFVRLATTDEATLRAALGAAGMSFAPSLNTWPRQARLLSPGDLPGSGSSADSPAAGVDTGTPAPGAPSKVSNPTEAAEAAEAAEDDLERVEGIGPRIGSALREAGIVSYRQLADAEPSTLQAALERAGLRFAPSLPTWSRQALLLADGDEAGFIALTEQFIAGHDVSGSA